MFLFHKPSVETIEAFLNNQTTLDLTYPEVGATATDPPKGYVVDHIRVKLGKGEEVFAVAREAVERWEQLRLGWVDAWTPPGPVKVGNPVAIIARFSRVWWLNACRILYLIDDEREGVRRFGFGYGTLPDHAASGEERFLLEWDRSTDDVFYDVLAFSRPNLPLARYGYFFMRKVQKHFGRVSAAAMRRIVSERTSSSRS